MSSLSDDEEEIAGGCLVTTHDLVMRSDLPAVLKPPAIGVASEG